MDDQDSIRRARQYIDLLRQGDELRKKIELDQGVQNISEITRIVQQSDLIDEECERSKKLPNPLEVVMKTEVLKMELELVGPIVQKVGSSAFSAEEYAGALMKKLNEENTQNWDALANIAAKIARTTKYSSCLLGAFVHDPVVVEKVMKERRRANKSIIAKEQKLESVQKLDKKEKGALKVNEIYRQIMNIYKSNNSEPIPYYKLIVDPIEFMHTVDNAFQIAFLVRDGSLIIGEDDEGMPTVRPSLDAQRKAAGGDTTQAISRFNMSFCKKIINKYKLKEPMLTVNRAQFDETINASQSSSSNHE